MGDERRLTVRECWARLQRIDEALEGYTRSTHHNVLLESRRFFEQQLEVCLVREGYKEPEHEQQSQ